jgi:hypothetical protein
VIVFGAGASYGATNVQPEPPPLGKNLYDALAAEYPEQWGTKSHLGRMWASQFRADFEQTMYEEVMPKTPSLNLLEWHRPMAAFFAKYRLAGNQMDMYSVLISGLMRRSSLTNVTLGSLNYDCLLEQAIAGLRLAVDYTCNASTSGGLVHVAKVHGSCNFITANIFRWRAYLTNAGSAIEYAFSALPIGNLAEQLAEKFASYDPAFYPVLGLYAQDKPSLVASAKLQKLKNMLGDRIRQARVLILIGVKPNRQRDPHLWEPVAETHASTIAYVGGADEFRDLQNLQRRATHLAGTFAEGASLVLDAVSDA